MKLKSKLHRLLRQSEKLKQRMVKSLLKTMRKIDQERKERTADLDQAAKIIGKQLADLGHRIGITDDTNVKKAQAGGRQGRAGTKKKRIRRYPEQLKAEATKAL